jgi:membrane fusion protein, adhesin transport system
MLPNSDNRRRGQRLLDRAKRLILPPAPLDQPKREDIPFMPNTLAALFLRPPQTAFLIVRCTLVLVVIFVLWATLSDLDEITNGDGKVIPTGQVQVIQNLEGGIVAKIPVKIGEVVQKDQIVLQLDETRFASSAGENKAKVNAQQAKIARLTAESTGQEFKVDEEFEKENAKVVAEEKALYESRKREHEATLGVLRQQLNGNRSRLSNLQTSYSLSNKELEMTRPLADKGVVSKVELIRLERQVSDLRRDMDTARSAIPEAESKLEGALAKFRADAANELAQVRAEFAGAAATGLAAEDRLARTTVRSPVAGIVKTIKINTLGGVIQPGMDVMEIVPVEDNLLIEVRVRPGDIGFLRAGQPATVKISAYDYAIYGGMDAVVENITADSITNEKGESFYLVRVRTDKNYLGTDDKRLAIIPGMLATASIRTGSKSVMSYLLKPLFKAKNEALRER